MNTLANNEYNLDGWGEEKRLLEGPCGHCHHAVAFKEPDPRGCLVFTQVVHGDDDHEELRTHYFVMGLCPRPRCQEATIVYRLEKSSRYQDGPELLQERVIFPATSMRTNLPDEVPQSLRILYQEASSIENLSPNGSAFLARRILEQSLRERLHQPRARLASLIEEFLRVERASAQLHKLMHDVREFGNIAGHPAQDHDGEWTIVDAAEASYTLDVVAELLDHLYVKPQQQQAMRERWQAKKQGRVPSTEMTSEVVVGGRARAKLPEDDIPF